MVRETIPPCCHIEFCISLRNLSVIVKTVQPAPTSQTQLPLQEHQIMKTCSACFTSSKREPQSTRDEHNMRNMRRGGGMPAEGADSEVRFIYLFFLTVNMKLQESYREVQQFHRPSSAQSSHNSELQRRCPTPEYFLWREDTHEHIHQISPRAIFPTERMITHISCVTIIHYCYIEGERWRLRPCYTTVHPSINRKRKKRPLSK